MKTITAKLTFIEDVLGTLPNDKEIYTKFIGDKSPDADSLEDEIASLGAEAVTERGTTVFPRLADGTPFLYDYQVKGFFKGAAGFLNNIADMKLPAYKKKIDGLIYVFSHGERPCVDPERRWKKIPFENWNGEVTTVERPLRAQTMQGERVSLARSECIEAGVSVTIDIDILDEKLEKYVRAWLDNGVYTGIGQWRNSGMGRFVWEEISSEEKAA